MPGTEMKTILLFLSGYSQAEKRGRDEVLHYARATHWRVQCVSYAEAAASRYHLVKDFGVCDVKGLLDFWKPDGCIVECGAAPFCLQPDDFLGVPVVFLDRDPSTLSSPASCVFIDEQRIAEAAFEELASTGAPNFAFAGWYDPLPWTVRRQKAFADILAKKGLEMHVIDMTRSSLGTEASNSRLLATLKSLPRPLAIFAANDLVAEHIIGVCSMNGLSIPDDFAVVGVDNLEDVCENSVVSISSVPQRFEESGRIACECLERVMANPSRAPEICLFGVGKTVRRASTRALGLDHRVRSALEFIRQHATFGIGVQDVVKHMGCSRRTADTLFKASRCRSILGEITKARVESAKAMLVDKHVSISAVAGLCGFPTINELDRVFRRVTGISPKVWRQHTA